MKSHTITFISPKYTQDKLNKPNIDDLIDILRDRVDGWLFDPAKKLLEDKKYWFGALGLLLTYFEGIWIYMTGEDSKGKSKEYFTAAFLDMFSPYKLNPIMIKQASKILYESPSE